MEVLQLLPAAFDGDEFPGYDNVRLSYVQLASILERRKQSWIAALENQKAVYLITDTYNGKLYVGSATSDNGMLLQRWRSYVENGHGENKELVALVKEKGFDYVKQHFQYSILENYNTKIDDHVVLKRESWWKDTLQSKRFGYNSNRLFALYGNEISRCCHYRQHRDICMFYTISFSAAGLPCRLQP